MVKVKRNGLLSGRFGVWGFNWVLFNSKVVM